METRSRNDVGGLHRVDLSLMKPSVGPNVGWSCISGMAYPPNSLWIKSLLVWEIGDILTSVSYASVTIARKLNVQVRICSSRSIAAIVASS